MRIVIATETCPALLPTINFGNIRPAALRVQASRVSGGENPGHCKSSIGVRSCGKTIHQKKLSAVGAKQLPTYGAISRTTAGYFFSFSRSRISVRSTSSFVGSGSGAGAGASSSLRLS